jgi:hypothetical protein
MDFRLRQLFRHLFPRLTGNTPALRRKCRPSVESLEARTVLSTASVSGTVLTYLAAPGETNTLTITRGTDNTFTIEDTTAPVTAGAGCTSVDARHVTCPAAGITQINISGTTGTLVLNAAAGSSLALTGSGVRAGSYQLGAAAAVSFDNVTELTVGESGSGNTVTVSPYADNTPAGWGLAVQIEGSGSGNHLVYDGRAGVSETIDVRPVGTSGGGRISDPGVAIVTFSGPQVLDVNGNDGSAGDTDSLTVSGTPNDDVVTVNLATPGQTDADPPLLLMRDAAQDTLLTLRNATNIGTLHVNTLDGADTINVKTGPGRSRDLFVDAGPPSTGPAPGAGVADVLSVTDASGAAAPVQSVQTFSPTSGLVVVQYPGAAPDRIEYQDVETNTVDPDHRFVLALYRDVLGRPGTNAELDFWVRQLNGPGNSQAAVAAAVERSPEACTRLCKSLYTTYLGRPAAGGEEQYWVGLLQGGATEELVTQSILSTPEYQARANAAIGSALPDLNFVQSLFSQLLHRAGSVAEVNAWQDVLAFHTRQEVAASFLTSVECRAGQVISMYRNMLHRSGGPTGEEVNAWALGSSRMREIRIGIEASYEFYLNG